MGRAETILSLIETIYAAATDAKQWEVFLERFDALTETVGVLLLPVPTVAVPGTSIGPVLGAGELDAYQRNAFALDPVAPLLASADVGVLHDAPSGSIAFQREWLEPHGCSGEASYFAVLSRGASTHAIRTFARRGRRSRCHRRLLETLLPHLCRAIEWRLRLQQLTGEKHWLASTLDRVPLGVLLVRASGEVVSRNRAADRILARRDALSLGRDGLQGSSAAVTDRLRRSLRECQSHAGADEPLLRVIELPRSSGERPLHAIAVACQSRCEPGLPADPGERLGALYVSDPDTNGLVVELLRRVFGLTPSEAVLACELSSGRSLETSARNARIGLETARTRLKQIFLKTGTHRQAELVRLLLTSPAQLTESA